MVWNKCYRITLREFYLKRIHNIFSWLVTSKSWLFSGFLACWDMGGSSKSLIVLISVWFHLNYHSHTYTLQHIMTNYHTHTRGYENYFSTFSFLKSKLCIDIRWYPMWFIVTGNLSSKNMPTMQLVIELLIFLFVSVWYCFKNFIKLDNAIRYMYIDSFFPTSNSIIFYS